jgi:hypothetical protein
MKGMDFSYDCEARRVRKTISERIAAKGSRRDESNEGRSLTSGGSQLLQSDLLWFASLTPLKGRLNDKVAYPSEIYIVLLRVISDTAKTCLIIEMALLDSWNSQAKFHGDDRGCTSCESVRSLFSSSKSASIYIGTAN